MADDPSKRKEGQYDAAGHHRPRGTRGGAQAPGHVHRLDRRARPAPPRLGGRRQLRRRGPGRQLLRRRRRRSIPTTRSPSPTTAAASPSRSWRRSRSRRPRSCSPSCTPAASSATAAATRSPAACTASASRSSTRSARSCTIDIKRDGFHWTQDYERGAPVTRPHQGRADQGDRHVDHLPARRRGLRDARARVGRPRAAPARDRLPDRAACGSASPTSAARASSVEFHFEGGIRDFVSYLNENKDPLGKKVIYMEGESERGRARGGDAVELHLPGVDLQLRQQHQHARGRLAPLRLPLGADADAQQVRARARRPQGEGREPLRRGHPRGPDRGHQRQAAGPAVRGPDQDQARQPRHGRLRRVGGQRQARRVLRGEPHREHAPSSPRRCRPRRRAPPRARRAT